MPSIIEGYNYDIFISYRQKDNKGDRWVSEFVDALKTELESTFKEEISVYFDINPHDGLLETHDVDESLKYKLKCLVFIPIISRTYCDTKSFAWEHEFKAFVEQASKDEFGLKVELPNGNVASRVLPVRIHDLDNDDIKLCESVLGGILRGIEFIYKEPGVNKPLTDDDNENKNLNKIKYRIQINKTANAIKEIISGLKGGSERVVTRQNEVISTQDNPPRQEKSIIVLPFENMSSDSEQEYFSDGLTEEIITDLSHIHDLLVISKSSTMTFKGTKKKVDEIAKEVNVHYVLEGSVRKAGNNLRITAQLIDGINDSHIWAEKYSGTLDDVFHIQEKVSRAIADALKIKIDQRGKKRAIYDVKAFEYYFRARQAMGNWKESELKLAEKLLHKGLEVVGDNTLLYSQLGHINYQYWNLGYNSDESCLKKASDYADKIFEIEADSIHGYFLRGTLELAGGKVQRFVYDYERVLSEDPNYTDALFWMSNILSYIGKTSAVVPLYERLRRIDPLSVNVHFLSPWFKINEGKFESVKDEITDFYEHNPEFLGSHWLYIFEHLYLGNYEKAISAIDKLGMIMPQNYLINNLLGFLKYALLGEKSYLNSLDPNLERWAKKDFGYALVLSECYSLIKEKEKAFEWLIISINLGGINYSLLNEYDPLLENIRGEERFKKLMERVKYEWENFEV